MFHPVDPCYFTSIVELFAKTISTNGDICSINMILTGSAARLIKLFPVTFYTVQTEGFAAGKSHDYKRESFK